MGGFEHESASEAIHTQEPEQQVAASWKDLFYFTSKRDLWIAVPSFMLSITAGCIIPAEAYLYGKIFSAFAASGASSSKSGLVDTVDKYCVWLVALGIVTWVVLGADFASWNLYGALQASNSRRRLFSALLDQDMAWFDSRPHGTGALLVRLHLQVHQIVIFYSALADSCRNTIEYQTATSTPLGLVIQYTTCTIASFGLAMYFSWDLTLVTIAILPVAGVAVWFCSRNVEPNIDAQVEHLAGAAKHTANAFSAIETVKCCNGQEWELRRFTGILSRAARSYGKQVYWTSAQATVLRLATLVMFVQGFWYGSHLVSSRHRDSGSILTTFWAAIMATQALMFIMPMLLILEKGKASAARLKSAVAIDNDRALRLEDNSIFTTQEILGHIRFDNVTFAYPTRLEQTILRNESIDFPAGRTTFVIGRSGSGKSTIGQLIARLYEPQGGTIDLDGIPINVMDVQRLRERICLVEQSAVLFSDTVAGNIALGRLGSRELKHTTGRDSSLAARFSLLDKVIGDLSDVHNKIVGTRGSTLSGGQKQCIALARAYVREPTVLILDEATSALDQTNRQQMMEHVRNWRKGKTTIIITHDVAQILPDDFVYLLDSGVVVQQGTRRAMETDPSSPFCGFLAGGLDEHQPSPDLDKPLPAPPSHGLRTSFAPDQWEDKRQSRTNAERRQSFEESDRLLRAYLSPYSPRQSIALPFAFTNPFDASSPRLSTAGAALLPSLSSPRSPPSFAEIQRMRQALWDGADAPDPLRSLSRLESQGCRESHVSSHKASEDLDQASRGDRFSITSRVTTKSRFLQGARNDLEELDIALDNLSSDESNSRMTRTHDPQGFQVLHLKEIIGTFWPNLDRKTRSLLVFALFWLLVYATCTPIFSYIFSKLLSTFYGGSGRSHSALVFSLSILGISFVDATAFFIQQTQLLNIGQTWVNRLRLEGLRRLLRQPRQYFTEPGHEAGRLAECLDSMAEMAQGLLGRFLPAVLLAGTMMSVAIVWSLIACWKLTLVGIATMPVMYAIASAYSTVAGKLDGVTQTAVENVSAVFTEALTNSRTVKLFTLERHFTGKFNAANQIFLRAATKRALVCGLFCGLADCSLVFVTALLFHYGAKLVASRSFSVEDILIVFVQLLFGLTNVEAIIGQLPQMSTCRDAASRLIQLARLRESSFEHEGHVRVPAIGDIAFNNLTFSYPDPRQTPAISELSLHIPAGSCVALVGSSGSGKSTIASLLLKLYSTTRSHPEGSPGLTLSGRDINRIHTPTVRNLITLVSQVPFLFPASIADNIAYGLPTPSPHHTSNTPAIRAAARAAGIHDFIASLPDGYDTLVGDGGTGVSGGQAQRICIARALARDPDVLILDEATSALDPASAAVVRGSVSRLVRERARDNGKRKLTVIVITHAREMMRLADQVVVLERGRLVERGSYNDLVKRGGAFARLVGGR